MPKYEWKTIPQNDNPRCPDYVMVLTAPYALWMHDCNGYDVMLVKLKPGVTDPANRKDIDVIMHAMPAMPNHDSGYSGEIVKANAMKYMHGYVRRQTEESLRDAKTWQGIMQDIQDTDPSAKKPLPVVRRRFRNREGWFVQLDGGFSIFVWETTATWPYRDKEPKMRRFEWWLMQGQNYRTIVRDNAVMANEMDMIMHAFDWGRNYVLEQHALIDAARKCFLSSIPAQDCQ